MLVEEKAQDVDAAGLLLALGGRPVGLQQHPQLLTLARVHRLPGIAAIGPAPRLHLADDEHAAAAPSLTTVNALMFVGWSGADTPSHLNLALVQPEPLAVTGPVLAPPGMPGGMLSLSADGAAAGSGILWAALPFQGDANKGTVPGVLRAFDASNVQHELWNSRQNAARDDFGNFAKFCSPTIADGKVFMATFSKHLAVYGHV